MTIEEALAQLELFADTEQAAPDWRWYEGLIGVTNNEELALWKANVAAGLGG